MKFSHTIETTATPEQIWAIWTDVAGWPAWDTELVTASLNGEFTLNARGTLKPRGGPAALLPSSFQRCNPEKAILLPPNYPFVNST